MKAKKILLAAALSAGLFPVTSAHAVLELTLNIGGTDYGVYDTDLNITWLRDANLAATNTFGVSGINANGTMNWNTTQSWIAGMNAANYLGYNDWRLPTATDTGLIGCNWSVNGTDCGYNPDTAASEMAHLYFSELGNKSYYNTVGSFQSGWGLLNTGDFSNFQSAYYWSGNKFGPGTNSAFSFNMQHGHQSGSAITYNFFALVVRGGDSPGITSPVPEPETYAMLLAGLGLLNFTAKRRKQSA